MLTVVPEEITEPLSPSVNFGDVGDDAGFEESEWAEAEVALLCCDVPLLLLIGGGVEVSAGMRPSFIRFFCFIRRFWNQILTWVSFSCNEVAISILLALVRYLLKWNSFSSSVSCFVVKLVLPVLFTPLPGCVPTAEQLDCVVPLIAVWCPLQPNSVLLAKK